MLAMNFLSSSMNTPAATHPQIQPQQQQPPQPPHNHPSAIAVAPPPPAFLATSSVGSSCSGFSAPLHHHPHHNHNGCQPDFEAQYPNPQDQQHYHPFPPHLQNAASYPIATSVSSNSVGSDQGEKRARDSTGSAASNNNNNNSNNGQYQHQQHPPAAVVTTTNDDDDALFHSQEHESSTKKRRASSYIPVRTVPTSFTSVTGSLVGGDAAASMMRRNLSFSRIDPYVSYAQTPSLCVHNNNNTTTTATFTTSASVDGMDMDASSGNHSATGEQRVRSMSF